MKENRLDRVNSEIKKELSAIMLTELRNPKIDTIYSITSVETTPDLAISTVYISVLDSAKEKDILKEIVSAGSYLRGLLAKRIKLRVTPRLIFKLDNSEKYASKIDNILKNITYSDEETE